jgi:hypothetical protein
MKGNQAKISRDNSAAVLRHLGFQEAIIPAILAAGPQPSFMDLFRSDGTIVGIWNGLVVTKDAKGKFKAIRQPGTNPPKEYTFSFMP